MKKTPLILSIVLILVGLVMAPALCGPLTTNDVTGSYKIDSFMAIYVTVPIFCLAAISFVVSADQILHSNMSNVRPWFIFATLVPTGLCYSIFTVYHNAYKILIQYDLGGGKEFLSPALRFNLGMYESKFSTTADICAILCVIFASIFIFFAYRIIKTSRNVK